MWLGFANFVIILLLLENKQILHFTKFAVSLAQRFLLHLFTLKLHLPTVTVESLLKLHYRDLMMCEALKHPKPQGMTHFCWIFGNLSLNQSVWGSLYSYSDRSKIEIKILMQCFRVKTPIFVEQTTQIHFSPLGQMHTIPHTHILCSASAHRDGKRA